MLNFTFVTVTQSGRWLALSLWLVLTAILLLPISPWPEPTLAPALSPDVLPELAIARLPLSFIPNTGQTDPAVHFQARSRRGTFFFTQAEVTLVLSPGGTDRRDAGQQRSKGARGQGGKGEENVRARGSLMENSKSSIVRLRFVGANPAPEIVPAEPLPGKVNYFIGDDPTRWQSQVPTYAGVNYRQLYPSVDLHYEGDEGRLKGTYIVSPRADPGQIRWYYEGAEGIRVDEGSGDLIVDLVSTEAKIIERAPVAWQEINGQRLPVSVRYVLLNSYPQAKIQNHKVGLALGAYDPAYPLIIDPTLEYSSFLGGTNNDAAFDLALDAAGNVYITGFTESANFPLANPRQPNRQGSRDVFISKVNAAGTALVYSTYFGGSGEESGHDIAIDASGNAYIVGVTDSANLPTVNPIQAEPAGFQDAFVLKLGANGNTLIYSTYLGGSLAECDDEDYNLFCGIAVDNAGRAVVTGDTESRDFPIFRPLYTAITNGADEDVFIAKLTPAGNSFVYSTYLGDVLSDYSTGVAVDPAGNAYVTGATSSDDFPTTPGAAQRQPGGLTDVFVTKLNPTGSAVIYSTFLGGDDDDIAASIAVDSQGNAYLTGETWSTDFPTISPFQPDFGSGLIDAFVAKLNAQGSQFQYSSFLGGDGYDQGYDIALDAAGAAYVVGETWSEDFPTVVPLQAALAGQPDAFVAKVAPGGTGLLYSTYLGGDGQTFFGSNDIGYGIGVDKSGNAYVTGMTDSDEFPIANAVQATPGGIEDAFIAKLTNTFVFTPTPSIGGTLNNGQGLAITFPPNAYSTLTTFHFTDLLTPQKPLGELVSAGHSFRLEAYRGGNPVNGFVFSKPLTVSLVYQNQALAGAIEPTLKLYVYNPNNSRWENAALTCPPASRFEQLNLAANRLQVAVCHLSEFGLMAETRRTYLPVLLRP